MIPVAWTYIGSARQTFLKLFCNLLSFLPNCIEEKERFSCHKDLK